MPPLRHLFLPHRLREYLACCPHAVTTYATFHLDSISKLLNHLLAVMLVGNILLWLSSWNIPSNNTASGGWILLFGNNLSMISFLLLFQTAVVWIILNNNSSSSIYHHAYQQHHGGGGGSLGSIWNALAPTDFMLGVALGITVGGSILAFCVSSTFAQTPWQCKNQSNNNSIIHKAHNNDDIDLDNDTLDPICNNLGSWSAVWFWSSLVFWVNFCVALLLAMGRRDLSIHSAFHGGGGGGQYEHIGGVDVVDNDGNHDVNRGGGGGGYRGTRTAGASSSASAANTSSFVGDYARIPEIRTGSGGDDNNNNVQPTPPSQQPTRNTSTSASSAPSQPSSSSETTRINASVLSV